MTEELDQKDQGAVLTSNELDGFAKRLAEWNSMSKDARALNSSDVRPKRAAGLPTDLAMEWIKKATCRSSGLARSIRSLERDLAHQRQELLEVQLLERQSAIAAVAVVMRRFGITPEDLAAQNHELIAHPPRNEVVPSLPPRLPLIGPQGKIWMRHGRRPNWLKQFLAAGGQLDDLLVSSAVAAEAI